MQETVKQDREKYIGGSDVPIIMGISKFKTRFDLLLEKAELKENDFEGNEYTEYGNTLEPQIRDFLNKGKRKKYLEDCVIQGDWRYHSDGYNGDAVLEIKTTSRIKDDVSEYKDYLVQLLFGMHIHNSKKGVLAVYERPQDFDTDFDSERLKTYEVKASDYKELLSEILDSIDTFRNDLERIKANPFTTEAELQPTEIIEIADKLMAIEETLAKMKFVEMQEKALKEELYEKMKEYNIKKWTTPNNIQITRICATEPSVKKVVQFNEKAFKAENEELYEKYLEETEKIISGRAGYVKITLPKKGG